MPSSSSRRRSQHPSDRIDRTERRSGWLRSTFKWLAIFGICGAILAAIGVGYLYYRISPTLPDVQQLRDVQLQMPLRVYTADGDLIAEYGEKRREPIMISQVPAALTNAIIAAEDKRFYEHPGVDYQGLLRAVVHLVKTGEKGPGGSTITMQVARNFFLSNERTYSRKLTEIFLSFKIEHELAKDEILELYLNKIYLGNRSYGYAAASKVYYGKDIGALTLTEAAMLAGLPKAPSRYNPIVNPSRALERRDYVLGRMRELDMISEAEYREALATADTATLHYSRPEAEADYVGEMVRARVKQMFGDTWSTGGYNVFTTIDSKAQRTANQSLREALVDYERRHGFRGPIARLEPELMTDPEALAKRLDELDDHGELEPAVVVAVDETQAVVIISSGSEFILPFEDIEWARERIDVDSRGEELERADQALAVGDVIHVQFDVDGNARFAQMPGVEGAFVAMSPVHGSIIALVGGFDFHRSKFNRVTQAKRQPGSTFKPFIYSAALEYGDTPATIYNDAPVVFHDAALEGEWRPSNYSGRFFGPTRLREALVKSRNLVSVRVLREITIPYAIDYAKRFGFSEAQMPPDLSLALGSASLTPMELASAFSVFANGGYRVQPHFIERIEDARGNVIYSAPKVVFCDDCLLAEIEGNALDDEMAAESQDAALPTGTSPETDIVDSAVAASGAALDVVNAPRVIDARNAFIMTSMMQEVVQRGTARRAGEALGRQDLAGKTGTTNNQLDAWFGGFNPDIVATAWIGSDGLDPLGRGEAGGVAALPMWTSFMGTMLEGVPQKELVEPEGIETISIDLKTGEPATGDGTRMEYFFDTNLPDGVELDEDGETIATRSLGEAQSEGVAAPLSERQEKRQKAKQVEQLF